MAFDHGTGAYSSRPGEREPRSSFLPEVTRSELREELFGQLRERLQELGAHDFLQRHPLDTPGIIAAPLVDVKGPDVQRYFSIQRKPFTPSILVVRDPSLIPEEEGSIRINSHRKGGSPEFLNIFLGLGLVVDAGYDVQFQLPRPERTPDSFSDAPYLHVGYEPGYEKPTIFLGPDVYAPSKENVLLVLARSADDIQVARLRLDNRWKNIFGPEGKLLPESSTLAESSDFEHSMDRIDAIMGTSRSELFDQRSIEVGREVAAMETMSAYGRGAISEEEFGRRSDALATREGQEKEPSIRDQVIAAIQKGIEESGISAEYNIVEDAELAPLHFTTNQVARIFEVDGHIVTPPVIALSHPADRTTHQPGAHIVMRDEELEISTSVTNAFPVEIQVARRDNTLVLQQNEFGHLSPEIDLKREAILLLADKKGAVYLETTVVGISLPEGYEQAFDASGKLHQTIGEALGTESDLVAEAKGKAEAAKAAYQRYEGGEISRGRFRSTADMGVDEYEDLMRASAEDARRVQGMEIAEQKQAEVSIYSSGETEIGPLRQRLWGALEDNKISYAQYCEAGTNPEIIRTLLGSLESPVAEAIVFTPGQTDQQEEKADSTSVAPVGRQERDAEQTPKKSPVQIAKEQYLAGKMGREEYLAIKHQYEGEVGSAHAEQQERVVVERTAARRDRDTRDDDYVSRGSSYVSRGRGSIVFSNTGSGAREERVNENSILTETQRIKNQTDDARRKAQQQEQETGKKSKPWRKQGKYSGKRKK